MPAPASGRQVHSQMSEDELRALPVSVDLVTAARAFGIGRSSAYDRVKDGSFPVPTMRLGRMLRCNRADIMRALGIPVEVETVTVPAQQTPGRPA